MRRLNHSLLDPGALAEHLNTTSWVEINFAETQLYHLGQNLPNAVIVDALVGAYPLVRTWQGRKFIVYSLMRYTRKHDKAYETAILALSDRSAAVVADACVAIGTSTRNDGLRHLRPLLEHKKPDVQYAARAAIDELMSKKRRRWLW